MPSSAIKTAAGREAALIFLPADGIWSEGSLPALAERLKSGKRAVFTLGTRVTMEKFIRVFAEKFFDAAT
ncbi:MAG: hypothetical protein EXQ91_08970 [Alphaproteobacteria bacterium]|nr:hypothetical protein [Alphaproteobacteria bacterium]